MQTAFHVHCIVVFAIPHRVYSGPPVYAPPASAAPWETAGARDDDTGIWSLTKDRWLHWAFAIQSLHHSDLAQRTFAIGGGVHLVSSLSSARPVQDDLTEAAAAQAAKMATWAQQLAAMDPATRAMWETPGFGRACIYRLQLPCVVSVWGSLSQGLDWQL